jgi:hypothetical protein
MAKIDDVINRLERLTNDVNQVKLSLIGLLPLPPVAKPLARRGVEGLDPILTELYFDALRGGVDLARDPRVQESSLKAIQSATMPKPRSRAQKKNDKMQSQAFKMANEKLRTTKGALRKGVTQSDIATRAQKELKLMKRGTNAKKRPAKSGPRKSPPRRSGGGKR